MSKKKLDQIKKLKEAAIEFQFESTESLFLKEPVKVGTTPQGDVICVSVHRNFNPCWNNNDLYLDVLFNFKKDKLYGTSSDFTPVCYFDKDKGKPSYLPEKLYQDYIYKHPEITMLPNAMELVLKQIEKDGKEWGEYQRNLRIRSRHFLRWAVNPDRKSEDKLSWEDRLEWSKVKGEIDHLMYRREISYDTKRYNEMLARGQEVCDKEDIETKKIADSVLDEILEERKNKNL